MSWSCSVDLEPLNIKWFYIILFIYIKYSSYSSRLFIEHGQIHLANGKRYSELPCTQMMCSYLLTYSEWSSLESMWGSQNHERKEPPTQKKSIFAFSSQHPQPILILLSLTLPFWGRGRKCLWSNGNSYRIQNTLQVQTWVSALSRTTQGAGRQDEHLHSLCVLPDLFLFHHICW